MTLDVRQKEQIEKAREDIRFVVAILVMIACSVIGYVVKGWSGAMVWGVIVGGFLGSAIGKFLAEEFGKNRFK